MKVRRDIHGSFVVVFHDSDTDHYIDARKDVRKPDFSCIEVVRNGRVVHDCVIDNDHAPGHIIRLAVEERL